MLHRLVKCLECEKAGLLSQVQQCGPSTRTAMGSLPYYDGKGRYHDHDPNATTTRYKCGRGHQWTEKTTVKCWCQEEGGEKMDADGSPDAEWKGNLEDDCSLKDGPYLIHAECMGELVCKDDVDGENFTVETWYLAVYKDGVTLFHSGEVGGHCYPSGEQARAMGEFLLKLFKDRDERVEELQDFKLFGAGTGHWMVQDGHARLVHTSLDMKDGEAYEAVGKRDEIEKEFDRVRAAAAVAQTWGHGSEDEYWKAIADCIISYIGKLRGNAQ